jgi:hypothetical protein
VSERLHPLDAHCPHLSYLVAPFFLRTRLLFDSRPPFLFHSSGEDSGGSVWAGDYSGARVRLSFGLTD